jgi:pimeloyl-ACP methyl ester carboxylesterase
MAGNEAPASQTGPGIASTTGTVEEGIVKLADTQIQYFSRGRGDAIILIPGSTLTVSYLDGLADSLAGAGYRVISLNLRGTGKSTGSVEGMTLQTNADDVAGVIRALGTGPVHVAGNDFGNRVARKFAASYPDLTRSVILLAAGGKVPPKPEAIRALQTVFNPQSTEEQVLAAMPFFVANPDDGPRVWAQFKSARDPSSAAMQEAAARAAPLNEWWAPPGETRYLILQGAEYQIAPPANGADLQRELGARAKLVDVPGAGHLLPIEQPDVAAAEIVAFIKGIDPRQ